MNLLVRQLLNGLDVTGGNFSCIVSRSQLYVVSLSYTWFSDIHGYRLCRSLSYTGTWIQLYMEIIVFNVYIYSAYRTIVQESINSHSTVLQSQSSTVGMTVRIGRNEDQIICITPPQGFRTRLVAAVTFIASS